jgi:hypothetical protein
MEIALAVVGVTDVAIRATSKLWALSEAWRDAPADLHNLRDDLTRTEQFFSEIQQHVAKTSSPCLSRNSIAQHRFYPPRDDMGLSINEKQNVSSLSLSFPNSDNGYDDDSFRGADKEQPTELGRLVDQGAAALRRIEAVIDGLMGMVDDGVDAETQSIYTAEKVPDIGKRRRFLWLRHSRKIAKLRKELGHIRSGICRVLIAQNM